jgi:hypothetical protein
VNSGFVEECRREWERLGVPSPVANEMAAEVAADLEEAAAEGATADEVLGSDASDPRSFAASWAAERGVGRRSTSSERVASRAFGLAAVLALSAIAVCGAVLIIVGSPSGSRPLVGPPPPLPHNAPGRVQGVWVTPIVQLVAGPKRDILAVDQREFLVVDKTDSGVHTRTVGLVLLIVGLAGIFLSTLFSLWVGPSRWSRGRPLIEDRPTGPTN